MTLGLSWTFFNVERYYEIRGHTAWQRKADESGTGGQGTDPTMKTTSQMRQSQLVKTFGDFAPWKDW